MRRTHARGMPFSPPQILIVWKGGYRRKSVGSRRLGNRPKPHSLWTEKLCLEPRFLGLQSPGPGFSKQETGRATLPKRSSGRPMSG